MIIAHLADLHLGRTSGGRLTPSGRGVREQDVSDAFAVVVDQVISAKPDLVLIAGDVFHTGRPSHNAVMDAGRGILRLTQALPDTVVIVIPGNHDSKGLLEGDCSPVRLLSLFGAVVCERAESVWLSALGCTVLAVPDCDLKTTKLDPGIAPGQHILLAHGAIGGRLSKLQGVDVLPAEAISPEFCYAALGDYHASEQIAPNAWYSGAIESTSSDIWRDADVPKGWLLVDTAAGTVKHCAVPTRRVIDLPRISAHDTAAADVTVAILAQIGAQDITGATVRQVVGECLIGTDNALDRRAILAAAAPALSFHLDVRRPREIRAGTQHPLLPPLEAEEPVDVEGIGHEAGEEYEYDEVKTSADVRSDEQEAAALEASRIAQKIPLSRWIEMHEKLGSPIPAHLLPASDPYAAEFAAAELDRERRAIEIDAEVRSLPDAFFNPKARARSAA